MPNLRRPAAFTATVRADRGAVSELPFARLNGQVRADGRRFEADLSTVGLAGVTARVSGELDKDQRGGRLDELALATQDARWQLAAPATVDLRDGVRVDHLDLRSGEQAIQAVGGVSRGVLGLDLQVRQLDSVEAAQGARETGLAAGGAGERQRTGHRTPTPARAHGLARGSRARRLRDRIPRRLG
ncbi:MAG: hypothetical protein QM765_53120 [Myxococcales bacterium]